MMGLYLYCFAGSICVTLLCLLPLDATLSLGSAEHPGNLVCSTTRMLLLPRDTYTHTQLTHPLRARRQCNAVVLPWLQHTADIFLICPAFAAAAAA
jgi:hypothetical protein